MQGKSALSVVKKFYPKVRRVIDARSDAEIDVTNRDCKQGSKGKPDSCALARAFNREYDGAIISKSVAYLVKGDTAQRFKVPNCVAREIVSFDRHQDFAPGQYYLKAPSTSGKLQPRSHRLNPDRHKKTYPSMKRRNHRTTGVRSL